MLLKIIAVVLFVSAMGGMWIAFQVGGTPFLLGALLAIAVYEFGYRATFGHWLDWKAGSRHQHRRHH